MGGAAGRRVTISTGPWSGPLPGPSLYAVPRYSVIIPTYNRSELAQRAVRSVLTQVDFPADELEVVVVDDGSEDGTAEALRAAFPGEPRLRVLRQPNAGECPARNAGVAAARGTYLVFLDSDDILLPWAISVLERATAGGSTPAVVSHHPAAFADERELAGILKRGPGAADIATHESWLAATTVDKAVFFGAGGTCIRADILPRPAPFAPHRHNSGDIHGLLRIGGAGPAVTVRVPPLFAYRRHSGNISGNLDKMLLGWRYILEQERAGTYPPPGDSRRSAVLAHHLRTYARIQLQAGRLAGAWELYAAGLRHNLRAGRVGFVLRFPLKYAWHALVATLRGAAAKAVRR